MLILIVLFLKLIFCLHLTESRHIRSSESKTFHNISVLEENITSTGRDKTILEEEVFKVFNNTTEKSTLENESERDYEDSIAITSKVAMQEGRRSGCKSKNCEHFKEEDVSRPPVILRRYKFRKTPRPSLVPRPPVNLRRYKLRKTTPQSIVPRPPVILRRYKFRKTPPPSLDLLASLPPLPQKKKSGERISIYRLNGKKHRDQNRPTDYQYEEDDPSDGITIYVDDEYPKDGQTTEDIVFTSSSDGYDTPVTEVYEHEEIYPEHIDYDDELTTKDSTSKNEPENIPLATVGSDNERNPDISNHEKKLNPQHYGKTSNFRGSKANSAKGHFMPNNGSGINDYRRLMNMPVEYHTPPNSVNDHQLAEELNSDKNESDDYESYYDDDNELEDENYDPNPGNNYPNLAPYEYFTMNMPTESEDLTTQKQTELPVITKPTIQTRTPYNRLTENVIPTRSSGPVFVIPTRISGPVVVIPTIVSAGLVTEESTVWKQPKNHTIPHNIVDHTMEIIPFPVRIVPKENKTIYPNPYLNGTLYNYYDCLMLENSTANIEIPSNVYNYLSVVLGLLNYDRLFYWMIE